MRRAIGLDFGTTNSSIAVADSQGSVETIQFRTAGGTTDTYRSVLYFEPNTPTLTGPRAIERYLEADEKGRLIQSLKSFLASRLFKSTDVFGRQYSVEDLITIIIRDLRAQAQEQVGAFDGTIVVGRPVRYSNASTEEDNTFALGRLKRALEQAGIGPILFEFEPVAAAYFYESTLDHDELIMIGDFGGGTSDFSLLNVGPSARYDRDRRRILGTEGVALAGDSFDAQIVRNLVSLKLGRGSEYRSYDKILPMPEWVYSDLERWHYLSFLKSNDTIQMLRSVHKNSLEPEKIAALLHIIQDDLGFYLHQSVQALKLALSVEPEGTFRFDDYALQMIGKVKRDRFEKWIEEDLQKIRGCVDRLLSTTGVQPTDIDRIFLTGGSSLVPAVRKIFVDRFGIEKISSGSEFTSVAKGLALRAFEHDS